MGHDRLATQNASVLQISFNATAVDGVSEVMAHHFMPQFTESFRQMTCNLQHNESSKQNFRAFAS